MQLENAWIEQGFNCDITTPLYTSEQLDLMEQGFPVKPNIKMKPISESYNKIIKAAADNLIKYGHVDGPID